MPPPTRDQTPKTYSPDDWAWSYLGGLISENIAFGVSVVPLPVAARKPVTLLPAKYGVGRIPYVAELPPHPPTVGQIQGIPVTLGSVLSVFDYAARQRPDRAADQALALFVAGYLSPPGGRDAVVWTLPVWLADPAPETRA